jgi:hypothetical protein
VAALCAACSSDGGTSLPASSGGAGGMSAVTSSGAGGATSVVGAGGVTPVTGAGGTALPATSSGGAAMVGAGGALPMAARGQPSASGGTTASGGVTSSGGNTAPGGATSSAGGGPTSAGGGAAGAMSGDPSSDVCTRWKSERADLSEGTWSGSVASCDAGDMSADARASALRVLNLYRFLGGLPDVTDDPARDAKDQQCALMMRANGMLSHSPPMSWTCWTQDGADAANGSNIGTAPAVTSVDGYMLDPGNPTTLGHRRWVLSNSLGPVGIGGTDRSSCMMTLGGTGKAGKAWAAWPAPGKIPFQVMTAARSMNVDGTGWSIQSDTVDLSAAQVTVTSDGAPLAITTTQLLSGYGSKYALRFNPMGWSTTAGKTYSVSVTGVTPAIAYDVEMVDCE